MVFVELFLNDRIEVLGWKINIDSLCGRQSPNSVSVAVSVPVRLEGTFLFEDTVCREH